MTFTPSCQRARRQRSRRPVRRRGMILLVVMVIIGMLSLSALTFAELMLTERYASQLAGKQAQARLLAESGIDLARVFLGKDQDTQNADGGWYDNPGYFQGVLVIDDELAQDRGLFTFLAPAMEDGQYYDVRFGLENESARLNLNAVAAWDIEAKSMGVENAGRKILMGLPNMTEYLADAILDWLDEDDDPREYGAEFDYYGTLDPPYTTQNGPLATVEELLLVREVTPWLLFGADANRNGSADSGEPDPAAIPNVDNSEGNMGRGWAAFLTLYSYESNLDMYGEPKINLNQSDMETLYTELEEVLGSDMATFIVAYRQQEEPFKPADDEEREALNEITGELDFEQSGKLELKTVLDLIGQQVQVKYKEAEEAVILDSFFPDESAQIATYLPTLMESLTTIDAETISGRININQAPKPILAGIPGMTSEILDQIIYQREPDGVYSDYERGYETWLLSEGIAGLDEMKALYPFITCGGSVFRGQVVGFFEGGGPAARMEVVLDAGTSPAKLLFRRDLTHLGRGFSLKTLSGSELQDW